MGYIWDSFVDEYRDRISVVPLVKVLEAFYYYSSRGCDRIKALEIMKADYLNG